MFEWPIVLIGLALGTFLGRARRKIDLHWMVAAVGVVALIATVSSGEFGRSWAYFGIDLLQTVVAFTVALTGVAWLRSRSPNS